MSPEALKEKIIERGLISIQTEDKEYKRRGGTAGFKLCRTLHTPQDFEQVLAERHRAELYMDHDAPEENYLEYRWGTLQVIHVFERLKVLWKYPVLSTYAVMHVTELLIEDRRER